VVNCGLPSDQCACYREFLEAAFQPTILATEHARIVAEKDARIAELEAALGKSVAAANLRDTYNQLPPDRNRIGDKKSPRSRARDIWLRALRKAEVSARAALKGDDNG
jgi:hypothetical protein